MATGTRESEQTLLGMATSVLPMSPGHLLHAAERTIRRPSLGGRPLSHHIPVATTKPSVRLIRVVRATAQLEVLDRRRAARTFLPSAIADSRNAPLKDDRSPAVPRGRGVPKSPRRSPVKRCRREPDWEA